MTFILLTCTPMLAAVLLLYGDRCEPRNRRPAQPPLTTPPRTLIHRPLAPPVFGPMA